MKRNLGALLSWAIIAQGIFCGLNAVSGEIGFLEDYSLSKNRDDALKQLIPGTEDYFYFKCIHLQSEGKLDQVEIELKKWIETYGYTNRVNLVRNRQALLMYAKDPAKSLDYLKNLLQLQFRHQKDVVVEKAAENFPSILDQNLISFETLRNRAITYNKDTVAGFELVGLDFLDEKDLKGAVRRDFLSRLDRPDYPGLAALVVADLKFKDSRGFGSLPIHNLLLVNQLDECLTLMPELRDQSMFVNIYITKLKPRDDVNFILEPEEENAYLQRLWDFAKTLAPVNNSLKSNILYYMLKAGQKMGVYDKSLFMEYIKLPRQVFYINESYLKTFANNPAFFARSDSDFGQFMLLAPVNDDTVLVNDFLQNFFKDAENWNELTRYVRDTVLKKNFAEAKILNGIGDQEKWYSMLAPAEYQSLKERVDIEFSAQNKDFFKPGEDVSLSLFIKNVERLSVKVYKINLFNYYKENMAEPGIEISLDGLVPNEEATHEYKEINLRRIERKFDFPSLKDRGVYVIEFIGNGKVSRAVVRKGKFKYSSKIDATGQIFTIYDEKAEKVADASIWMDGHFYQPEKDGTIILPFTNNPAEQKIIISSGGFSSLDSFQHQPENYSLKAGFYVDRESLVKGRNAKVSIRPVLYIGNMPISLAVLENIKLSISTTDLDGVDTTKIVDNFKLDSDKDSIHTFNVPANIKNISFTLKAQTRSMSKSKNVDLSTETANFAVNGIDSTDRISELLFGKADGKYKYTLLDKSGRPMPGRPVTVSLKHKYFTAPVVASLKTDANGVVQLGELKEIAYLNSSYSEGQTNATALISDIAMIPANVCVSEGDAVAIPYMGSAKAPSPRVFSLIETRGGTFVKDWSEKISIANGILNIKGLPQGNYSLSLKEGLDMVSINVEKGKKVGDIVLSDLKAAELSEINPLQIESLAVDNGKLVIKILNASGTTRIHVFADIYNFGTSWSPFAKFADSTPFPEPTTQNWPLFKASYQSGRAIGDEFEYIIRRRYAKKFTGNMLERPGLILNPFVLRDTITQAPPEAKAREAFAADKALGERQVASAAVIMTTKAGRRADGLAKGKALSAKDRKRYLIEHGEEDVESLPATAPAAFSNLDFLAKTSPVFSNLIPDKDGKIEIPIEKLGGRQDIAVIALDDRSTVLRSISIPSGKVEMEDVRLAKSFDIQKHFVETKKISALKKGEKLTISDILTSSYNVYDSVGKIYGLYNILNPSPNLSEFSFVTNWSSLDEKTKSEKYSKYACHELNYFIYRKDRPFFDKVILPFIRNKKDKTFLDKWFARENIEEYLQPGLYRDRLNTLEKILLAGRLENQDPTKRFIMEQFDMIPPNPQRYNFLFSTALKSAALEANVSDVVSEIGAVPPAPAAIVAEADEVSAGFAEAKPAAAPPPAMKAMAKQEKAKANKADAVEQLRARRGEMEKTQQLYRKLDQTKELAENNYYKLPIEQQTSSLVNVNAFWNDFATKNAADDFLSTNIAEASGNFTEIMLAMASESVPFVPEKYREDLNGRTLVITAESPLIVFHKEISEAEIAKEKTPLLAGQRYFLNSERFTFEGNRQIDKYVSEEFLANNVYGCCIFVTNPTSAPVELDVLLQIPQGALPVAGGFYTKSFHWNLQPFMTQRFEYFFYFPEVGTFGHYPAQISINEKLVASCEASQMNVVKELSKKDIESWNYVSQNGTDDEVLAFIAKNNVNRLDLNKIAFRMKDKAFFGKAYAQLEKMHAYNDVIWSYGICHNFVPAIREYLKRTPVADNCGKYIVSEILTIDPVIRRNYQFLEYSPFVNARTCQFGQKRAIFNDSILAQYNNLLDVLSFKKDMDNDDLMSVTYYMLLQDRVEEAMKFFTQAEPAKIQTKLQYDYFMAYMAFYNQDTAKATGITARYAEYPVIRWRNKFLEISNQLAEIKGEKGKVVDQDSREVMMTDLASKEPALDFQIEGGKIKLNFANLSECRVNYYFMDIEFLFSTSPFAKDYGRQFSYIFPNKTDTLKLQDGEKSLVIDIPAELLSKNVLVEINGSGKNVTRTYYANTMNVKLEENYGQIKVAEQETGKNISAAYVKVYARLQGGNVIFFKDGYTDLRGRFDYTSLNTDEITQVEKFSILIMSEKNGSVVKEANPPKR